MLSLFEAARFIMIILLAAFLVTVAALISDHPLWAAWGAGADLVVSSIGNLLACLSGMGIGAILLLAAAGLVWRWNHADTEELR